MKALLKTRFPCCKFQNASKTCFLVFKLENASKQSFLSNQVEPEKPVPVSNTHKWNLKLSCICFCFFGAVRLLKISLNLKENSKVWSFIPLYHPYTSKIPVPSLLTTTFTGPQGTGLPGKKKTLQLNLKKSFSLFMQK